MSAVFIFRELYEALPFLPMRRKFWPFCRAMVGGCVL
jgi:hypothetical protein